MKYQLYYIPNKNKLDPSYMEKTRSILVTSPYAVSQIPVFSQVPFIIPNYKLGIMKPQPLSFTYGADSPHEPYINLDELKLVIDNDILEVKMFARQGVRNPDYDGDQMIPVDTQELKVLSHKQLLDLLNQLLRFKQDVLDSLDPSKKSILLQKQQHSQAISPIEVHTEEKVLCKQPQVKKESIQKPHKQKHISMKPQHKSHHRHKSRDDLRKKLDEMQKQLTEMQRQPQYVIITGQQEPKQQHICQEIISEPKKQQKREQKSEDNISEQLLKEIEKKLDQISKNDSEINAISPNNQRTKQEIEEILNKNVQMIQQSNIKEINQPKRQNIGQQNLKQIEQACVPEQKIKYKTYLPRFSKELINKYTSEVKRQHNYNIDYQSKLLSPAFIRTKLDKQNVFKLLTDEILSELIDETIAEFVLFVQEIMYKQNP